MRLKLWIKCVAMAFLAALISNASYATEATVAGDAYVTSAHPSTNYGYLSNLYVGNGGTALIQFDLSSLPSGTTSSQIGRATLKLYVNRVNTSALVSVLPVTSAWSESAVTYATIPSLGSAVTTFTPTTAGQYIVVDITSLVQSWVTTPSGNYGIALTSTGGNVVIDSKENDETAHAAQLDITLNAGATGPAGTAATIQLGPVTTGVAGSSASVTNSGTASSAILNFTIPQGAIGATGANGTKGDTGAKGDTGEPGSIGATGPPVSFKGAWSSSYSYTTGDAVSRSNGSSYIALTDNTGYTPETDVAGSGGHWALLAQAGTTPTIQAGITTTLAAGNNASVLASTTGTTTTLSFSIPQGIQGIQGVKGDTGSTGPAGPTGATGTIGVVTDYSSTAPYGLGGVVFCPSGGACNASGQGSSYVSLISNNIGHDPYTTNGIDWQMIAQAGATGPQGVIGATGPQGTAGTNGAAATISVDPTTTTLAAGSSASVTNTGTSSAAVLKFSIPQGANGEAQVAAWSSGTSYTAGTPVTDSGQLYVARENHTSGTTNEPGTSGGVGVWGQVSLGSGTVPAGIPYTVMYHNATSTTQYLNPVTSMLVASTNASTMLLQVTTLAPTSCTPSLTVYSLSSTTGRTFYIDTVPLASDSIGAAGGTPTQIASCSISGGSSGGTPSTCTVTASTPVAALTGLTIEMTAISSSAEIYTAFSCQ